MLGRLHHVVLDCPEPAALAAFYSRLLGQPITYQSEDWVVVAANDTSSGLAFQLAPDYRRPTWPDPAVRQQIHLDVMVEDVASAEPRYWPWAQRSLTARTSSQTQPATRSASSRGRAGRHPYPQTAEISGGFAKKAGGRGRRPRPSVTAFFQNQPERCSPRHVGPFCVSRPSSSCWCSCMC